MKCWRILYVPDNTAFMVWAESKEAALNNARERNCKELDTNDCVDDYIIDEFTPETNEVGILVFYDIYTTFERTQDQDKVRYQVYQSAQTQKKTIFETESEQEAIKFCEDHHWKWADENNFIWDLEYKKLS